ncbi:hypothetical protein ALC62_12547 [Cyphomyrmex costatus]|uniref:Uncharacterized protein n=1 Tax=Cyphomyrmex costatus TaxID=456900 RepID=A0A195C7X8_9HYME|nr:hypothetical protein ALC62_12547 [Cyphomyrmex costatus]
MRDSCQTLRCVREKRVWVSLHEKSFAGICPPRVLDTHQLKHVAPSACDLLCRYCEVNSVIPAVDSGVVGRTLGDSLRAHLDPRSFAVRMTRRERFASVNRATRGPRPIECGTRWCGGT